MEFLSPEVLTRELPSGAVAPPSVATSVPYMLCTAKRGPINRPQPVIGIDDYASIYDDDDGGDGYQSMVGFFLNGGRRLLVNRVAHYPDINDLGTLTAVAADETFNTSGTAATAPEKTTTTDGPWDLSPAAGVAAPVTLIASIDGNPADTLTIAATPSVCTAPGAPGGAGTTGHTGTFNVNGVSVVVTLPASPPTSAVEWALEIASQLPGVYGSVVGGAVVLTTDRQGSTADVSYVSGTGTFGADSGFGAGPVAGVNAGPNDVADLSAVTPTELAALITSDWTSGGGATGSVVGSKVKATGGTTGSGGSIGAVTGTASSVIAFSPAGTATGADIGSPITPTLDFAATSEGEHGNFLAVTIARRDRVVATLTADVTGAVTEIQVSSTAQFRVGMQIFVEDAVSGGEMRANVLKVIGNRVLLEASSTPTANLLVANAPTVTKETFDVTFVVDGVGDEPYTDLSMNTNDVSYYVGNVIGTDPTQLDPRQRVYVSQDYAVAPSNTVDPRPVNVTEIPLTGGVDSDPVTDNDYVGSATTETGLQALNNFTEFDLGIIPGVETVAVHNGMLDYAALREDHFAIMEAPEGYTPTQVNTYVQVTANLFGTFGAMYAGRIKVLRQSTGQGEAFPAAGYIAGAYARTAYERNISEAPAGIEKGQLRGTLGMSDGNVYKSKANRDLLYPNGINPIWAKDGQGVVMWGQNTLDPNSDRGAIGVRLAFNYLRKGLQRLSEFVLFEVNTPSLRGRWRKSARGYMREQRRAGVVKGATDDEAFYLVCDESNNGPDVVNARKFFARVGANVLPGVDFAVIDLQRDTRSLDAELASAA